MIMLLHRSVFDGGDGDDGGEVVGGGGTCSVSASWSLIFASSTLSLVGEKARVSHVGAALLCDRVKYDHRLRAHKKCNSRSTRFNTSMRSQPLAF